MPGPSIDGDFPPERFTKSPRSRWRRAMVSRPRSYCAWQPAARDHRYQRSMWDATGRWVITFNGEIYNHYALRLELERLGCLFRRLIYLSEVMKRAARKLPVLTRIADSVFVTSVR